MKIVPIPVPKGYPSLLARNLARNHIVNQVGLNWQKPTDAMSIFLHASFPKILWPELKNPGQVREVPQWHLGMPFSVLFEILKTEHHMSKVLFGTPLTIYITLHLTFTVVILTGSAYFVWDHHRFSGFEAFFLSVNDVERSRQANLIFFCQVIVVVLYAVSLVWQLWLLGWNWYRNLETWCFTILRVAFGATLFFCSIYPLVQVARWASIFGHSGREDLVAEAVALQVLMALSLVHRTVVLGIAITALFFQPPGYMGSKRDGEIEMVRMGPWELEEVTYDEDHHENRA